VIFATTVQTYWICRGHKLNKINDFGLNPTIFKKIQFKFGKSNKKIDISAHIY